MPSNKQYAAVGCYYGKWPNYFQFWLTSCSYNPTIDFFLVTDINTEGYSIPPNVHIVRMEFCALVKKIRSAITLPNGKAISCVRPYKLCDFKVAYGHIFRNIFEGYDYWGFYDIDTIWGNLQAFIPSNTDCHWLKIFPCGHLSFVRNQEPYIDVYKYIKVEGNPTWDTVFSTSKNYYFDEQGGLSPHFKSASLMPYYYCKPDFDNICPPQKRKWRNFNSINFPEKNHFLCYSYEEGHLYRNYLKRLHVEKEEISYLHISRRAMSVKTPIDKQRFIIYPNCFDHWQEFSVLSLIWHGK